VLGLPGLPVFALMRLTAYMTSPISTVWQLEPRQKEIWPLKPELLNWVSST